MPEIRWDWIDRHLDDIGRASVEHVVLVVTSIVLAAVVAIPLAVLVRNHPVGRILSTGSATALYTIPSIALFAILVALVGIGRLPAILGLAGYAVGVLLRNTLNGLAQVPAPALDAARGMGMSRRQILRRVQLPLAVPAILTGMRLATAETVAIATIAVFVAGGGLGNLIYTDGITRDLFFTPILVGTLIAIVLAVAFDLALHALQLFGTRWQRAGGYR